MKKDFVGNRKSSFSLKSKMAIAVTLLTAVFLSLTGLVFSHFFQQELKNTISRQNFTLVTALAGEIDRKVLSTRDHLQAVAQSAPADRIMEPDIARDFLDERRSDLVLFDDGLFVFSPALALVASVGNNPFHCELDCSFEKALTKAIKTRSPQISEPFFSSMEKRNPVVTFAAPILTKSGEVAALLIGNVDLLNDNFLGELAGVRLGQNGYLYLYNQQRTLIVHPNRKRILQQDVPVGANKMFDRALEGFEGTGETVTSWGLHSLSSFKRLPTTGWILAANFPMAEAYAPVRQANRHFFFGLIALLAVSASGTWFLMRRLTAPIADLSQQISAYTPSGPLMPVHVKTADEIGTLAETFNQMLFQLSQQQLALNEQVLFLQVLIDVMPNPIFYKDAGGKYLGCNKAFETFTALSKETLIGKTVFEIAPLPLAQTYYDADADLLSRGADETQTYEASVVHSDKTIRHVVFYKATFCDQNGNLAGLVGTMLDITDHKNTKESLEEKECHLNFISNYDRLTHLPNRFLFTDRLQQAINKAKHSKEKVALLVLDLDRFKTINDSLGRKPGDRILHRIAERLKSQVRESDTLAKIGGDEFAIILEDVKDLKSVLLTGQQILKELSEPLSFEGKEIYLTASIGISMYPNDGDDFESLFNSAEAAMNRAKENGRNNCQFYRPEMNRRSKELLFLEGAFRQALKQDQFILYFQPQVDLGSRRVIGAEALVRWRHPTMGMIPPSDFIPLAEETGLIFALGDWVLREACKKIREWTDQAITPVKVSVNISALQFGEAGFIRKVDEILEETGVNPCCLEIEITESAIIENVEEAVNTLNGLKDRGIKLAIDDFGTGYSSLSYLQNFPITHLKIDRSFVKDVCSNEQSAKIASSIIALAHAMSLEVIAEGVETAAQMEFLKARGCKIAQGYLFGRPVPPEEFEISFLGRLLADGKNLSAL